MELKSVKIELPSGVNIIIGQAHFIKTVEDLYEALVSVSPSIKFAAAFCESSGPALVRFDGNHEMLKELAVEYALKISAGHCFVALLMDAYPINVLNRIKHVDEVVNIYCSTANAVEVLLAETEQGRGIIGVVDGVKTKGVEGEKEKAERREFLRKIGYKR